MGTKNTRTYYPTRVCTEFVNKNKTNIQMYASRTLIGKSTKNDSEILKRKKKKVNVDSPVGFRVLLYFCAETVDISTRCKATRI